MEEHTTDNSVASHCYVAEVGDYVLATKYSDGDPCDHFYVGFVSGYTHHGRYLIVDNDGNNQRGNGFRRVERITQNEGHRLVAMMPLIGDRSGPSVWWQLSQIRGTGQDAFCPACKYEKAGSCRCETRPHIAETAQGGAASEKVEKAMKSERKGPYKLPEEIDGSREFAWGPVLAVHRLPALDIIVVEYVQLATEFGDGDVQFHLYGAPWSFNSLVAAVVYGVGRHLGADMDHVRSACYLLGIREAGGGDDGREQQQQ